MTDDLYSYLGDALESVDPFGYLAHIGVSIDDGAPGRGSGRYPKGSGENPYQHGNAGINARYSELKKSGMSDEEIASSLGMTTRDLFYARASDMTKQGMTEKEIAKELGMSTGTLRAAKTVAKNEMTKALYYRAKELEAKGYSRPQIAKELGLSGESRVRSLLNEKTEAKFKDFDNTTDFLRDQIDEKGIILVGTGTELELGIARTKMDACLEALREEGYMVISRKTPQAQNPKQKTSLILACKPGTTNEELNNYENYKSLMEYHSSDDGETFDKFEPPVSMDSKRIYIRYAEEGGKDRDGTIELRRGVEDISLGKANYAQVRIGVNGTHYMKGMALYSDDIPDGYDVVYNTNKHLGTPMMSDDSTRSVLKPMEADPTNPFGTYIKVNGQRHYIDPNTGERKLGVVNKVREEGDWEEWSSTIASQMLSKQPEPLIQKQLSATIKEQEAELNDILALDNPSVRKYYLNEFANKCDKMSVNLKAAAFPGQRTQVILPVPDIKEDECYAPNFDNGTKLALVRYPHSGPVEIPILTVNNKSAEAKKILPQTMSDGIGIHPQAAEKLSGADFDGDTVIAIPISAKVQIQSAPTLPGLKDFDTKSYQYNPSESYTDDKGNKHYIRNGHEFKIMKNKGAEMGKAANLITDMQIQGCSDEELERAIKYSMVVIDAKKHKLDWKQCAEDNDIQSLKEKYQKHIDPETGEVKYGGATTLLSRAKSPVYIPERQGSPYVNKETGELIYKNSGREKLKRTVDADGNPLYSKVIDKETGKPELAEQKVYLGSVTKDMHDISTGTRKEELYADYSNALKALANQARKIDISTKPIPYKKSMEKVYRQEVDSINAKLNNALKLQVRETKAQTLAAQRSRTIQNKYFGTGKLDADAKKQMGKIRKQQIDIARAEVGLDREKRKFDITPREWEAMQSGAISGEKIRQIFRFVDPDVLRNYASPKETTTLSEGNINRIRAMANTRTNKEIADALGISLSQVSYYLGKKSDSYDPD